MNQKDVGTMARMMTTRTTMAAVLVITAAGCSAAPVLRESSAPVYMDGPANLQREDVAANSAVDALRKFSGESLSKESWLQDLTPLVTTTFAREARNIDPPDLKPVTVRAADLERPQSGTGNQVRVRIGTDAGEWIIVMTNTGAGAPWLASSIFPANIT